jgi:hypothetical protein
VSAALTGALRAHAAGLYPDEAGTELLIRHGGILLRDDFSGFVHTGTSISDGTTLMAWIDWDAALSVLHDGQIPLSGGEQRILQLASIAEGFPILPERHPPRPGQPEPETPGHSHPSRRRTTPPVLASHHLSRLGRPPRPGLLTFTRIRYNPPLAAKVPTGQLPRAHREPSYRVSVC